MGKRTASDYYKRRERQERELAEAADSPAIRNIHDTLARNYAQLALEEGGSGARRRLHVVVEAQ